VLIEENVISVSFVRRIISGFYNVLVTNDLIAGEKENYIKTNCAD